RGRLAKRSGRRGGRRRQGGLAGERPGGLRRGATAQRQHPGRHVQPGRRAGPHRQDGLGEEGPRLRPPRPPPLTYLLVSWSPTYAVKRTSFFDDSVRTTPATSAVNDQPFRGPFAGLARQGIV